MQVNLYLSNISYQDKDKFYHQSENMIALSDNDLSNRKDGVMGVSTVRGKPRQSPHPIYYEQTKIKKNK